MSFQNSDITLNPVDFMDFKEFYNSLQIELKKMTNDENLQDYAIGKFSSFYLNNNYSDNEIRYLGMFIHAMALGNEFEQIFINKYLKGEMKL